MPVLRTVTSVSSAGLMAMVMLACSSADSAGSPDSKNYPWHTNIVSTTFWVGEVLDPNAVDGSQMVSAYDANWYANFGGCDGVVADGRCQTEPRSAQNDYFPTRITPLQNPFYLDLPYDDINIEANLRGRAEVVPWADEPEYLGRAEDRSFSFMKNRWVKLKKGDRICFGQVQDAGPARYDDARYVFGADDARPANTRFNNAGLDVSPALNGCLGFQDLDGSRDRVDWAFVDEAAVPEGPWTRIVTTSPVVVFSE
ncbi:hypothetical protein JGU71_00140 [Antrihabitans sp. YC3-6]|uniref:Uncharacterized protein n=1 Tax=Antrihabitans stalagmiti TaxID=2799499 RepID=A0A934NLA0_9NOCA|nr:hypothetical protein [Antrihabitans stalagmiti]MBJ8337279.1 hypothetical protein [Antrihabitans stalagmiti]